MGGAVNLLLLKLPKLSKSRRTCGPVDVRGWRVARSGRTGPDLKSLFATISIQHVDINKIGGKTFVYMRYTGSL